MVVEINDYQNPDVECNECGESDWSRFENGTPPSYPQGKNSGSDVTRYQYNCNNCGGDGRIYEENGHNRLSGKMR
jgi:hypothetical protein